MPPRRHRVHAFAAVSLMATAIGAHVGTATAVPTRPSAPAAPTVGATKQVDLGTELSLTDIGSSGPAPVGTTPVAGPPSNLTGNLVGCAANCITSATLTKQALNSQLAFQIHTNVAARTHIWMSTNPIQMIGNIPIFLGQAPKAASPGFSSSWSTNLTGLSYDTTYNVIVRATDLYGNQRYATTSIRTIHQPGAGDLAGVDVGCYYDCITHGYVLEREEYSEMVLSAFTSVPADIEFFVSTQEPGHIGLNPVLPADEETLPVSVDPNGTSVLVVGLEASTEYNVLVRATDADGFVDYALGQFTTNAEPAPEPQPDPEPQATEIRMTFERIHIVDDGDLGAGGQGEISFRWGAEITANTYSYADYSENQKLSDGDGWTFPADSSVTFEVLPGDTMPNAVVNAREEDWVAFPGLKGCLADYGGGAPVLYPGSDGTCNWTRTVAMTGYHTPDWLDTLPSCVVYGFAGDKADDKCALIYSGDLGGEYADFEALISYRIL